MGGPSEVALLVVRAGVGHVSFLEAFWLLVGLACLKDSACLFWDARAQLAAAAAPPVDETLRNLATVDYRSALQAVLVQACFVGVGVIAAFRPPPPRPTSQDETLAEIATVALLVTVQLANAYGASDRRRYTRRIDRGIQRVLRITPRPGGRRFYDPPEGGL